MDDGRLDRIEAALLRGRALRMEKPGPAAPGDFTAQVLRSVRQAAERPARFWDLFGGAARRFAPVGALAAGAACGYAQYMERLMNQALLSLSMHGGGYTSLAGLLP